MVFKSITIHSKDKDPDEIVDFCISYKKFKHKVPLVVVPTTYNSITEQVRLTGTALFGMLLHQAITESLILFRFNQLHLNNPKESATAIQNF